MSAICTEYLHLSRSLSTTTTTINKTTPTTKTHKDDSSSSSNNNNVVIILLLRSGRFAGGVFTSSPSSSKPPSSKSSKKRNSTFLLHAKCLDHTTKTRYTVRRGQGGSQSAKDNASNSKAISVGARLRRQGEVDLRQDVSSTLARWEHYFQRASLILCSCPANMKKAFFEDNAAVLSRGDDRLRDVKLVVKKPSFEEVCRVHEALMTLIVRPMTMVEEQGLRQQQMEGQEEVRLATVHEKVDNEPSNDKDKSEQIKDEDDTDEPPIVPLTPLHEAAARADVETLRRLLRETSSCSDIAATDSSTTKNHDDDDDDEPHDKNDPPHAALHTHHPHDDIDIRAGPKAYTPLHYAASSFPPPKPDSTTTGTTPSAPSANAAAQTISLLLLEYHANPSIVDAHGRPPYHVTTHDVLRDAFRMARFTLGEEAWDWTASGAKVGPPLSPDMVQERKQKQAAKKKRQRARQKQKKAAEKQRMVEEEEKRVKQLQEEEAKRVRDGLKPKKKGSAAAGGGGYPCDLCEKVCKTRAKMFARLEYWYCSTDCVKRHQRELMANAAAARMSSS